MTPLDVELHDRHVAAAHAKHCTLDRCRCPACGAAELILRTYIPTAEDRARVTVRATDFAGSAYPYVASVRVDGREVYRIHDRPDECLAPDVIQDVLKALRRKPCE